MQGIADLGMGEHFRDLARKITIDVHKVLSGRQHFLLFHFAILPVSASALLQAMKAISEE